MSLFCSDIEISSCPTRAVPEADLLTFLDRLTWADSVYFIILSWYVYSLNRWERLDKWNTIWSLSRLFCLELIRLTVLLLCQTSYLAWSWCKLKWVMSKRSKYYQSSISASGIFVKLQSSQWASEAKCIACETGGFLGCFQNSIVLATLN